MQELHRAALSFSPPHRLAVALLLTLSLTTAGCMAPLQKHSLALASATAPVIDQAAAAYGNANALHDLRIDYDAVAEFDATAVVYNPRNIQSLMSDKDIQARLAVLAAFQSYVQSLVAITAGTDSPELQAAAKSAGQSVRSLGGALAPSIDSIRGIAATPASTDTTVTGATTTTTTASAAPANPVTPAMQAGVSTALDAMAQFLINRKAKKELPRTIQMMDPQLKLLCDLLQGDIAILKDQENRDYNFILTRQTLFIRTSTGLDPESRREQIMKLPETVRQERVSSQRLTQLGAAISHLELTHHALAAEAQGNNPESLNGKLGDLVAAGTELGNFYSAVSASAN